MSKTPETNNPKETQGKKNNPEKETPTRKPETPTSYLEDLMTLFKLRFLKQRKGWDGVGREKLEGLESQMKSKGGKEKKAAELEISKLFRKSEEIDRASGRDVSLEETIKEGGLKAEAVVEPAKFLDVDLARLKKKGEKVNLDEIQKLETGLIELAVKLKVNLKDAQGEQAGIAVNREIWQLREMKDRLKLAQSRHELQAMQRDMDRENVGDMKKSLLEKEDLKPKNERDEKKRVMVVTKGRKRKEQQVNVDGFLKKVTEDLGGDGLKEMNKEALMKMFLDSKNITRHRYGGLEAREKAYDLGMEISFVYGEEMASQIAERMVREIGGSVPEALGGILRLQALEGLQEVWARAGSKMKPETALEIVRERLELVGSQQGQESGEFKAGAFRTNNEYAAAKNKIDKILQRAGGRGRGELSGELNNILEEKGIGPGEIFNLLDDIKREHGEDRNQRASEFVRIVGERYGFDGDTAKAMYKDFGSKDGQEHYINLREKLDNEDYVGYTRELMAYLARVGLQEGQRDIYLSSLMTEARAILGKLEDGSFVELFESFEKIMIFQDAFGSLSGMEDYAKLARHVGVKPFMAFMEKHATTLNVIVQSKESGGDWGTELSMGAWDFRDMLEEEGWAKRMHYRKLLDTEDVYRDMMVSKLKGETCWVEKGVIKDAEGKVLGNMSDKIKVSGAGNNDNERRIDAFVAENVWMVNVAHGYWRASGRWANVLDDVKIGKSVENKDVLSLYKIRRYAEEYGFLDTSLLEALGVDGLIYSFENYKSLVGKGVGKLMSEAGIEEGVASDVGGLIGTLIKNQREIRGEYFATNNMSVDDVRVLGKENYSYEEAKTEFVRRQAEIGSQIVWSKLSEGEKKNYKRRVEIMQKRHKKQRSVLTTEEWGRIKNTDWKKVNEELGKRLGVEIKGDTFEDFMQNFSYTRMTTYAELRSTDLQDFGGYCVKMEGVVGVFKSGFTNGSTTAMVEALGTMTTYDPWHTSGYDRFALKMMEVVYDLRKKKVGKFVQPAVKVLKDGKSNWNLDGETMANGEFLVDENGYWIPTGMDETMLWNESLLEKHKFVKSLGMADVEYAMRFAVSQGIATRGDMENFMKERYGSKTWRWMRRAFWVNDPWFIWDAAVEDGGKVIGTVLKSIFSS